MKKSGFTEEQIIGFLKQALADQLMDNIEAFQRGQPVNVVVPDSPALGRSE